ncbi:aminotransferase class V-fold PLP-dependent enzyme [Geobacter sp. AOG1]|uniref:aminotransferase class V-fold PLP-dependent enzyme n=1 Tax=Geobacter sp. AOG1 TaxID=1566346 RepID=UPI001CC80CF1|nr:aminotransferase class V-fold PLP-dependent enzyme [Geobacter sp. AOG1]GFE57347.1 cysteine desulfurase [Geobacter sp. AOG1]
MEHSKDLIYFDNAATSWPKPEHVYSFMMEFYRATGVNPGRSGFDLAIEAGSLLDRLRLRLTRFFGGDEDTPERLCFGYNATDALNLIIGGVLERGDHVITTNLEHNSVIRPINHLVRDGGVEATFIPFDGAGFVDPDDIAKAIRPATKLVIVNHGSNVIGTIQPVKEIGRICRERGVTFVIDTTQTAGIVPIDMKEMNVDALAFTGHKALMGTTGIGGLCIRKHLLLRQTRAGGTGVESIYPYHLEEYPWRMEFGTPNMLGVASLWAGQDWLDEQGVENIHAREMVLAKKLVEGLRRIEGVRFYCCDSLENHLSTFMINIDGLDAGDVGMMLDVDHNIATRTGLHCAPLVHTQLGTVDIHGGVRFSVGAFNTDEQVDVAIGAVTAIARWSAERRRRGTA